MTIAESQAKHAHILKAAPGESSSQMWARSWQFTNNVCYDNRAAYAMIHKSGGQVCGPGVDCDKIIERVAPYRIYDLVRSGGSTAAEPICDNTGHTGKPADFAEPLTYGSEPQPGPTPIPPPTPVYPSYEALGGDEGGKKITRQLEADYRRAGKPGLDGDCGAWQQRVSYDFLTGICTTVEASITKHRGEWCAQLGIPVE